MVNLVTFEVTGANPAEVVKEGEKSTFDFVYTGINVGSDTITVTWQYDDDLKPCGTATETDSVEWTAAPSPSPTCPAEHPNIVDMDPPDRTSQPQRILAVGQQLTVSLTVLVGENRTTDASGTVTFTVKGANPREQVVAQDDGTFRYSYTGRNSGRDLIRARYSNPCDQAESNVESTLVEWVALDLEQSSSSSVIGTRLGLEVVVTSGHPYSLAVNVEGANRQELPVTQGDGKFTASFVGVQPGVDTMRATATWRLSVGESEGEVSVDEEVRHQWTLPEVKLSTPEETADLGETAHLTATVSGPSSALTFRIVEGPHAGLPLDGEGTERSYVGTRPGTDVIVATAEIPGFGPVDSNPVERTWRTPAVVLSQRSDTSIVGTEHVVTAEVTGTASSAITFDVTGANGAVRPDVSGGHPAYTLRYTGASAGADLVAASIVTPQGERYSAEPLAHEWLLPAIIVTQETQASQVGEPLSIAAVTDPPVDGTVVFRVSGAGAALSHTDDGRDGHFTASYTRDSAGTDTITATLNVSGRTFASEAIDHEWTQAPPLVLSVTPSAATTCTGSPLRPTVSLREGDVPVSDTAVRLTASMSGQPDQQLSGTTDADGRATVEYTRPSPGLDSLVAAATVDGRDLTSSAAVHTWRSCDLVVIVGPAGATSRVAGAFTPTVRVLDHEGRHVVGASVEMRISMAGQPDILATVATDEVGAASSTYSRPVEGTDHIAVVAEAEGRRGEASISHFWAAGELAVRIDPAGTTSVVGSPLAVTALVTEGEAPVAGAVVAFRGSMAGQPDAEESVTTDENGLATFEHERAVAGVETIRADASAPQGTGRAAMEHSWIDVPGVEVTLAPVGTASEVGKDFAATVAVRQDEAPVAGVPVELSATMPGAARATLRSVTNQAGEASFTYRRDTVGPDTLIAVATLPDGSRAHGAMTHLWRDGPRVAPPVIDPSDITVQGVAVPGGRVTASGRGCPPGGEVRIAVDDAVLATTRAGPDGRYRTDVQLADHAVGRHTATSTCPPGQAETPLDVIVQASATGTADAAAVTTAAVFTFFVLLGGQMVRFSSATTGAGSS
jgi:hypothetical protein